MRIIGIDPGTAITGYSVLDVKKTGYSEDLTLITSGSIQTCKQKADEQRLLEIHQDLCALIEEFQPDIASVEKLFFFKNLKTVMPVAQARGVIIMTLAKYNIKVYEYTPLVIKQTVTGFGRAPKEQVREACGLILSSENMPKLDDATDAIAIALCHSRVAMPL
ncbi:MAG: crossover junction endodeoxyribonuclease RuvC [Candidatus Gastranaerophilaceae bacterium]|jgi:crossover junction endodeoxyribonuclease RuvC